MSYHCELAEQPAQKVLSIRTRAAVENLPQVFGQAYGAIINYLNEIGEYPAGPPFAAYYNLDMQDLDVEAGFPVTKALPGKDSIKPGEIPGGEYASCLYTGPYSECEPAYDALTEWLKEKSLTPTGVAYEFYLNDPAQTPETELQTRILIPIK